MSFYSCRGCPRRCGVTVYEEAGNYYTKGNTCNSGHDLAIKEHLNPNTAFNGRIKLSGKYTRYLNVSAEKQIPKVIVPELLTTLKTIELSPPVKRGAVVLQNACGSGIDIVADSSVN